VRGGPRPGAGRKPGSKNRVSEDARTRAAEILRTREAGIIRRLLACPDARVVFQTWALLKSYGHGRPSEALTVTHELSVERVLEELARKRLTRATVETRLLSPAADTEGEP
jgi:hypothetical protein